jgi:hypothetical protein
VRDLALIRETEVGAVEVEFSDMSTEELTRYILFPEAMQEYLKREESRHMPGKHNQKDHGHGGHIDTNSPDGKKLVTITKKWQGQSGQVEAIQADFMTRAAGKKTRSKQRDEHMRVLKDGIKNSPTNDATLYRGVRMPKGTDVAALKGKSFVIPPSSFSSDKRIANHFTDQSQTASTTVTYRMAPNKGRALKISEFGDPFYKYEKESISAGQFKVTGVEKVRGGWIADIEHTAMFDWEG